MVEQKTGLINLLKSKTLLFVVFLTGACVLVLEVVATRILSPYFGNTIFTVSSVIGVVLTALSFGYYFGGKYADKNPNYKSFYSIIILSGFLTILIQIFNNFFLEKIAYNLSFIWGPLIISLILFFVPSFFLGMLSPFAIKLYAKENPKLGIGKLSGEIFFFSTFGSIVGTFLTGFYLIPNLGIDKIVTGVGILLFIIGITGNFQTLKSKAISFILILFFSLLSVISLIDPYYSPNIVYSKDGVYERLKIEDLFIKGRRARFLRQDVSSSSAAFLNDKNDLVFEYTKYYRLYKLFNENPKKALFIGGGAYVMPSRLVEEVPGVVVDVTEIEPELYDLAKIYFNASSNPRLNNHIMDGRRFLHDSDGGYDIIFSDVYSSIYSIPSHFTTSEYFKLSKEKLSENGIFIANIISDMSRQDNSLFLSEVKTFQENFPNSYFIAVYDLKMTSSQNVIFLGIKDESIQDGFLVKAKELDDDVLSNLDNHLINIKRFDLSNHPIITDNYSPTEILSSALIKRSRQKLAEFNGDEAKAVIKQILGIGSRHVGSDGNNKVKDYISTELKTLADNNSLETWDEKGEFKNYKLTNIIGSLYPDKIDRVLLVTHFDSLIENPGANNSASGVAALLEILRTLVNSDNKPNVGIDFVFFDGEEGFQGEAWNPYGSKHFAENIKDYYPDKNPQVAVDLDMVCDKDLDIYFEKNSMEHAASEMTAFMDIARKNYPLNFHKEIKYKVWDDHSALYDIGIPSFLLIDFDYPYYNTPKDTVDKCSAKSLEAVGQSIIDYIYSL